MRISNIKYIFRGVSGRALECVHPLINKCVEWKKKHTSQQRELVHAESPSTIHISMQYFPLQFTNVATAKKQKKANRTCFYPAIGWVMAIFSECEQNLAHMLSSRDGQTDLIGHKSMEQWQEFDVRTESIL